jgi:protein SCO1/2
MRNTRTLLFVSGGLLVTAAVVLLSMQIFAGTQRLRGSEIDPAPVAMDFQLQNENGSVFHLADEQGKVVLLFFMYTHCPDECPATLGKLQNVSQRLGDEADRIDFVFITADPQRDTPQVMADYVHQVNPTFIGLSGSEEELRPIWEGYFVGQFIPPHEGTQDYAVEHSLRIYVIDKQGRFRLTFPNELAAEDMAHDVSQLLTE